MTAALIVPSGKRQLVDFALDLVQKCTVSVGMRSSYYNVLHRGAPVLADPASFPSLFFAQVPT